MECSKCITNDTVKSIKLDNNEICQFCHIQNGMEKEFPLNEGSEKKLFIIADKIKKESEKLAFDCVVGVSGGRDSSYLL